MGYTVKGISDREHSELEPNRIYEIFKEKYVENMNHFTVSECHFKQTEGILAEVTIEQDGKSQVVVANGNGRLDAVSNAIKQYFGISYELSQYEEHALSRGSSSKAVAYVGLLCHGQRTWGVGIQEDIIRSSIDALVVAVNQLDAIKKNNE